MAKKDSEKQWTPDQQAVIDAKDCELLVSAAAGSGKTAVLVERIVHRLMDEKNPIDIDRLVVVTFTIAAAAQMKDRLRSRIEEALSPEGLKKQQLTDKQKEHLQRQLRLIPGAHISTVHSFCRYVINQYFHKIGLDPSSIQASEAEQVLMKQEAMDELLAREYAEGKESFLRLADSYKLNKSDSALEDWISETYKKAISEPFPDLLFKSWKEKYHEPLTGDDSVYIIELIYNQIRTAESVREMITPLEIKYSDIEEKYLNTIKYIKGLSEEIISAGEKYTEGEISLSEAYNNIRQIYMGMYFGRDGLPKSTKKEDLAPICAEVSPIRERLENQNNKYFKLSAEDYEKDRIEMAKTCDEIIRLTESFSEIYQGIKRDRGVVDFNDLEQYALQILFDRDPETNMPVRSKQAIELSEQFAEIMIDEYQDSNRVQDTILWAVSQAEEEDGKMPWKCGSKNRFMVGDIKQSIYRFRNACPELFRQKLDSFSDDEKASHRKISLHKNFRSREGVLDATNAVFEKVMHRDIGGISYDEDARLVAGPAPLDPPENTIVGGRVRIDTLVDFNGDRELNQARHILNSIDAMVNGYDPIFIEDNGEYRRVKYSDIVILSGKVKDVTRKYMDVFRFNDIPLVCELSQGFYESREISLIMALLEIVDNPRQDIPLASVITGPVVLGISDEELARIQIDCPRGTGDLYARLKWYESYDEADDEIKDRVSGFFETLQSLREKAPYITTSALVEMAYRTTGLYDAFVSLKDGEQRRANLDYLLYIAREFDAGRQHGVHAFVEYIKKIRENTLDSGEASIDNENENVVRMMSIHKSKGLEFPVVFVTGMDRDLTSKPGENRFVFDEELGMAGPAEDIERGLKRDTLPWEMINAKNKRDELGEKLRLLYVAMTRAKDQLILVRMEEKSDENPTGTDYYHRIGMKSFAEMTRPATEADSDGKLFYSRKVTFEECTDYKIVGSDYDKSEEMNIFDTTECYDEPVWFEDVKSVPPAKVSVSDIKKASIESDTGEELVRTGLTDGESEPESHDEDLDILPRFMREDKTETISASERGTIWHHVMATIDFTVSDDEGSLQAALDELVSDKRMERKDLDVIDIDRLGTFFKSDLAHRMRAAYEKGTLHREQPLVLDKPACEIFPDTDDKTPVMIQGIIDGYFEEDDGVVLIDYKTDRVGDDGEDTLIKRYRVQMELYREALEKVLKKKVKDCYLYSFSLGRAVRVELD